MKALTVQQLYANLIMSGDKQFETRSRLTKHRGQLAIHAAKAPIGNSWERHLWEWGQLFRETGLASCSIHAAIHAPYGVVLGIVNVVDAYPVTSLAHKITERELSLGWYREGWYAWKLEVAEVFEYPVAARGNVGLWNWEMTPELEKA